MADPVEEDSAIATNTVLALCWQENSLGYALFHDVEPHKILVGLLVESPTDHTGLSMLKASCKPSLLLVPQSGKVAPPAVLSSPDGAARPPGVKFLNPAEFSADFAKEKLRSGSRTLEQWALHIDIENSPMMRSLGALLSYAQRSRHQIVEIDDLTITRHTVAANVIVEDDALRELQVFKLEAHPAGHQGIGKAKEGLSLYGLVSSKVRTSHGRALLREWFMRPSNDVGMLTRRLDCLDFFCRESCGEAVRASLRHVRSPGKTLSKLATGNHTPVDWDRLYRTAYHYAHVVKSMADAACHSTVPDLLRVDALVPGLDVLLHLCEAIGRVVDIEKSLASNKVHVREGCDEELDRCNHILSTIPSFLTDVAQREMEKLPPDLSQILVLRVVYFPQFGYHLAVPAATIPEHVTALEAVQWSRAFATEDHIFFKNSTMQELDTSLGDIHSTISEAEARLVRGLEELVGQPAVATVLSNVSYVWRLDALLGMSEAAVENHWVRPALSNLHEVDITCGRHPLLTSRSPVSNDCTLRPQGPRVMVLTGANNSGKSVFLKQCALIVFMAHVGCYVPAEAACIGPISAILTCTNSALHASFSSDVTRVGRILRFPSPHAFVIIDEFGKGTLAEDGIALLASLVNDFLDRGGLCPLVLLTTHYTEVLEKALIPPSHPLLDVCAMTVTVSDDATVGYTYRRGLGIASGSHALPLALRCGVPQQIVDRASVVAQHAACGVRLTPLSIETTHVAERRRHALQVLRVFASYDFVTCDGESFNNSVLRRMLRHGVPQ